MATERIGDPWSGVTYNGFAGVGPRREDDELRIERPPPRQFEPHEYRGVRRPRRRISRNTLLGGGAAAIAAGLAFGLLAKPDLVREAPPPAPMQPVTASSAATVPVEVAQPAPPPEAPAPAGKLEVLPAEMAKAAETRAVRAAPARPVRAVHVPAKTTDEPREIAAPIAPPRVRPPEPAPTPVRVSAPAPRPSFDCRYAGTRSERMVCGDPRLAGLDRRLDRAFERAVAAGIPYRELRAEQDDWLAIREDAARHSPDAVESVYRQRIAELDDLADY
ncbi:hypothetical protein PHZ_c0153 [Phenylobacterium zucineum HLK1]|uniref:Lysozyme inhibitor LprI N-terminal domain-containing protein n=1 Tax=Phenylobacterium zucineum (strain HLK1) TaxID=450851 RepID=B4RCG8_PHEZH|nr:hypothetical protein [Phenylobacterium zucineum]ACG76567.1 hypothetical protein PHZ_c0153 [Phenylobacterium zucineum HLK1]